MSPATGGLTEHPPAGALAAAAALPLPRSEAEAEEDAPHPPADKVPMDTVKTATVAVTDAVVTLRPAFRLSLSTLIATAATALERMAPGAGMDTPLAGLGLLASTGIVLR